MVKAKEEGDIRERYLWKVYDRDGSGCITKDEYHTNMMSIGMGLELTEKFMAEDYAKYDTDEDGHLRYENIKVGIHRRLCWCLTLGIIHFLFQALLTDPQEEEKKRN